MKKRIFILILMLIIFCTAVFYGTKKVGYNVDEMYSYGLSNSQYMPFMHLGSHDYMVKDWMEDYGVKNIIKDIRILKECNFKIKDSVIYRDYLVAQANNVDTRTSTWLTGDYYKNYLTVQKGHRFDYLSVYYDQRGDVHPPLFYMLLHTVCSLFPDSFSVWYGVALNIVYMMISLYIWYDTLKDHIGGVRFARMNAVVWGLSCGFVASIVLIRMYALMTLMCVLCTSVHLKIADDDFKFNKKNIRQLILSVFLGFYTHYYFVIFAIGIALVSVIWMATKKYWKELLRYIVCLATSAVIGLCIWPFAIRHVFLGYRGQESLSSVGHYNVEYLVDMTKVLLAQFIKESYWVVAIGVICLVITLLKTKAAKIELGKVCLVTIPSILYIILVSQMAPFRDERYVMCTFPFVVLMITGCFYYSITKLDLNIINKKVENAGLIVLTVLLLLVGSVYMNKPQLWFGNQEAIEIPKNTDCVYVLPGNDWNESVYHANVLSRCDNIRVCFDSMLDEIGEESYTPNEYVYVFVRNGLDVDDILEKVKDTFGITGMQEVSRQQDEFVQRVLLKK